MDESFLEKLKRLSATPAPLRPGMSKDEVYDVAEKASRSIVVPGVVHMGIPGSEMSAIAQRLEQQAASAAIPVMEDTANAVKDSAISKYKQAFANKASDPDTFNQIIQQLKNAMNK